MKSAKVSGAMVCMELGANSKVGSEYIPNDPEAKSKNGGKLLNVVNENDLVIVHGTKLCNGVIIRSRLSVNGLESSVIEHLIVLGSFSQQS